MLRQPAAASCGGVTSSCLSLARCWLAALVVAIWLPALIGTVIGGEVTVIARDLGGDLAARLRQVQWLRDSNARVEIRGTCASSCTLLLGLPNACVAASSRLGFHGPRSGIPGLGLPPAAFEHWSQIMARHYPAGIRRWFLTQARQTTVGLRVISGAEAIRLGARGCG